MNEETNTNNDEQPANDGSTAFTRFNENISSEKPVTEPGELTTHNSELITQDMEVHKHPHHVMHKKKFGEYLLEFFMLFLAVFLGFLAENIREHVVENARAKEFSKSLIQDLKNDTSAVNNEKKSAHIYIAMADSLLELSKTNLEGRAAAKFSFYTRFAYWTTPISWNRATFDQIKNSGSLRYFKNALLLKKLLEYDAIVNDINSESDVNTVRGAMLLPLINSIIDPSLHHELSKYFLVTIESMSDDARENFFSRTTGSLESKREKIREMLNMVIVQQRNLQFQIDSRWQQAQALAVELISDIKKEYNLD